MADQETPNPPVEGTLRKRIGRYDLYWDMRTMSQQLRKSNKSKPDRAKGRYCLIVKRIIDQRGRHADTHIDIESPKLLDLLLEINDDVEGCSLTKGRGCISQRFLFYSHNALLEALRKEEGSSDRDEAFIYDIKSAIYLIEEDQGTSIRELKASLEKKETTYEMLWALFKPNTLVFNHHSETEENRILLLRDGDYGETDQHVPYFGLNCDIIQNDGSLFGMARVKLKVMGYQGSRDITTLSVFPLSLHADSETVYKMAVERGLRLTRLETHAYREFNGYAVRDQDSFGKVSAGKFYSSGRVMISPLVFKQFNPECSYNEEITKPLSVEGLSDDEYAICSPIVFGFAFNEKSWGGFAMSRLEEVIWNDDAFDRLVLDYERKALIHDLVKYHASPEHATFDDIIRGKGKGVVGLLAGSPGCGKTLTAEAVAEVTHKPLYVVSAGELGTTPEHVERRLLRALQLAQTWDAVLLLDEADVFLQQRSTLDITRNSLVAIFLRQLEYYKGIMILTTNMADSCDDAFESRIHFSVQYPDLDLEARKAIWKTFFERAQVNATESEVNQLAEIPINGRQIKNVFSSAQTVSLARGAPRITIENINVVLKVLQQWTSRPGKAKDAGKSAKNTV